MLINSVSYGFSSLNGSRINRSMLDKNNSNISFNGGIKQEILRNQLKVFLSQDIWAEKLAVKKPETPLEKEVLLEILQNRQKLDRFARLNNEKYRLINEVGYINTLLEKDPENKALPLLMQKLINKGNLESVFRTLDKNIELEVKKNKPAFEYIKNLENLRDEYYSRHLVNDNKMTKVWYQIKKNNINVDNKYSTKELIDIISNDKFQPSQEVAKPLTKKQFLEKASILYEKYLLENVDVYDDFLQNYSDAKRGRKFVSETYNKVINKYPEVKKQLPKIYEAVENKIMHKVDRLIDIDIYPIGDIWKDMKKVESEARFVTGNISKLKTQLEQKPDNLEIKAALKKNEKYLEELKEQWQMGLGASMKLETVNRLRFVSAGKEAEYDYLTAANKNLNKYKDAYDIFQENNNRIPEDKWPEILG